MVSASTGLEAIDRLLADSQRVLDTVLGDPPASRPNPGLAEADQNVAVLGPVDLRQPFEDPHQPVRDPAELRGHLVVELPQLHDLLPQLGALPSRTWAVVADTGELLMPPKPLQAYAEVRANLDAGRRGVPMTAAERGALEARGHGDTAES